MNTLEKEFVPYQESLELKELGFDEPCFGYYENEVFILCYDSKQDYELLLNCSAPTFSQCFKWFREKYQLHNGIYPYYDEYEFQIKDFRLPTNTPINGGLMPYEEAELACLIKLIEIVKNK
jgi:hypothetical protein